MAITQTKGLNFSGFGNVKRKTFGVIIRDAVSHYEKGFARGGRQTDRSKGGWRPRQSSRDSGRPILVKTTRLSKSIRVLSKHLSRKKQRAVIGTRVPYGRFHNEGTAILPVREFIGDSRALDKNVERIITRSLDQFFKVQAPVNIPGKKL